MEHETMKRIHHIDLDKIKITHNMRDETNLQDVSDLMRSIKKNGLQSPIHLMPDGNDGFEIVAGHRRFNACKKLEFSEIPAIVFKEKLEDKQRKALNIIENTHRKSPSAAEYGKQFSSMLTDDGYTVGQIAAFLDLSEVFVRDSINVFNSIPAQYRAKIKNKAGGDKLTEGDIHLGTAKKIINAGKDNKKGARLGPSVRGVLYEMASEKSIKPGQMEKMIKEIQVTGCKPEEAFEETQGDRKIHITLHVPLALYEKYGNKLAQKISKKANFPSILRTL